MIVHGGAGSGKSSVIKPLAEWLQVILQEPGDDPDSPHIVLSSFTGAASANINGQTMHSLFGFKFGTKFISLADQKREETRCRFRNLKVVIIDEISMVSADLFYIFDLKMREIMQINTPFGGLAIFFFGDLFQLRPPKGKYPFEEPQNREHSAVYHLRNLWQTFTVVILEENHRQGDDKTYADLLNRVRNGEFTDEDINLLETRVRDSNDPDVKKQDDALHIYGTNSKVNARNKKKVYEIEGELIEIKAENRHRMVRNFKPKVDAAGCILNTPFQAVLQLKRGAQVIMVHNVDTIDGLTNGARGVLLDVEKSRNKDGSTEVKRLIIKFHNAKHGQEQREKYPCKKFPEGTYVSPMWWQYTLGGSTAEVYQFPIKMAAAITAHNIQGQTVTRPNSLFVNTESAFQAGMVYVMLSRVCCLQQLIILGKLKRDKIKACPKVISESKRMEEVSVNRNPTSWNNGNIKGARISSLNVRSLRKHIEDVRSDTFLLRSDVICLQETWKEKDEDETMYHLDGYQVHFNSQGRGKGLAIYIKKNFKCVKDIRTVNLQISKISSETLDVIVVYRTQEEPYLSLKNHLQKLINPSKETLIVGDFNFCFKSQHNQCKEFLVVSKFEQLVQTPTHIEGALLDHAYFKRLTREDVASVELFSNYYSDHDTVTVLVPKL